MAGRAKKAGGRLALSGAGLEVPTRPLTYAEQEQLVRVCKSSKVGILRVLGALFSLGAIVLAASWYLGVPYDPNVFPVEVIFVGILGAALAGGARSIVRAPRAALRRGEVVDVTGTIQPLPTRFKGSSSAAVTVGPLAALLPIRAAQPLTPGLRHRLVLALESRRLSLPDLGIATGALLLALDDAPAAAPRKAYVARITPSYVGGVQAAAVGVPMPGYPAPIAPSVAPPAAFGGAGPHVFCPRCGYENAPDARFCPRCGTWVPVLAGPRPAPG